MKEFGIDISHWQGDFDFAKAIKEGVKFVVVKGGGGDGGLYVDSKFVKNYTEAKKNKLPIGVYWYSKALSIGDAEKEADYFYNNVLKDRQFDLPIYIDVEEKAQFDLGKKALTDIIITWLNRLQNKKFWVGIYSSTYYFNAHIDDARLQNYAHWVAEWSNKCTYKGKNGVLGMWQFGGETNLLRTNKVAGVVCDQNYMLIDYPTLIKSNKLNGYDRKEVVIPVEPPVVNNIKKGDKVKLSKEATAYGTNNKFYDFVYNSVLYVRELKGDRAVISTQRVGAVTGAVNIKYLTKI